MFFCLTFISYTYRFFILNTCYYQHNIFNTYIIALTTISETCLRNIMFFDIHALFFVKKNKSQLNCNDILILSILFFIPMLSTG